MRSQPIVTLGRPQEAEEAHREALAIWQQLATEFPSEYGYRMNLGTVHAELGEWDKAQADLAKAVEWMEKNRPQSKELFRLRQEAAQLLGLQATKRSVGPSRPKSTGGTPVTVTTLPATQP